MLLNEKSEQFSLIYDHRSCEPQDTILIFWGDQVLLRDTATFNTLPSWEEVGMTMAAEEPMHLFTQGTRRVFMANAMRDVTPAAGYAFEPIRIFRSLPHWEDAYCLTVANHLRIWYANNRFCGVCGGKKHPAPVERALVCEQCGHILYPTISPAVIIAITD